MLALSRQPEPAPDFLAAVLDEKAAKRQALTGALLGRHGAEGASQSGSAQLDGGARTTIERPETHAEILARVLRDGSANVGASF